jgi:hypothetical protein
MVNRAHAVLSDDAQRAAYDRRLLTQLPSGNGMPQASSKPMGHGSGHGAERASERVGATTRWLPGVRLRSRWADLQQVVHAHGLRLLLSVGVLLGSLVVVVGWAMQGSGKEARLVVTQHNADAVVGGAAGPDVVALRIPAQWAQGVMMPAASLSSAPESLPAQTRPQPAPSRLATGPIAGAAPVAAVAVADSAHKDAPLAVAAPAVVVARGNLAQVDAPLAVSAEPAVPEIKAEVKAEIKAEIKAEVKVEVKVDAPQVAEPHVVWDVDVPSARVYLQDLLNQLAQPEQARLTSYALTQMNVRGSLLRPDGVAGRTLGAVQIERADLRESHRPGVLSIRGVMSAHEHLPNDQTRAVRWRVQADFRGTPEGTVLTLLDLKDTQ